MAKNDGRTLQDLVAAIERILAPTGFTVRSPVVERDSSGLPIAELDVLIEGTDAQRRKVRWLLECRDRPSMGPQGVEWIEQLVGRRGRLQLDLIVAVSTTGFTAPARGFAAEADVVLRTVTELAEVVSDVFVQNVAEVFRRVEPRADIELAELDERPDMPVGSKRPARARLRRVGEERFLSLAEFAVTQFAPERDGFVLGTSAKDAMLDVPDVEILFDDETVPSRAARVRIPIRVEEEAVAGVAVSIKRYDEAGAPRGHVGVFAFDSSQGRSFATVQVVPTPEGAFLVNVSGEQRIGDYVFTRAELVSGRTS